MLSTAMGAPSRTSGVTKPAAVGPSTATTPGAVTRRSNQRSWRRAAEDLSIPPRDGSNPMAVIGPFFSGSFQRAMAALIHSVGISCHTGSAAPALKSPRSIWERRGSGRACSWAL